MKIKVNKSKCKKGVDYENIELYETMGSDYIIGLRVIEGNIDGIPLDSKLFKILNKSFRNNDDVKITWKEKLYKATGYMQVNCLNIASCGTQVSLTGKGKFKIQQC